MLDTDSLSIEISMGESQIVDSIALHLRGGDAAAGAVADIISHLELRAVDSSTGDFSDPAAAVENLRAWRAFRDRPSGRTAAAFTANTDKNSASARDLDLQDERRHLSEVVIWLRRKPGHPVTISSGRAAPREVGRR
jgi:hypothetical protein